MPIGNFHTLLAYRDEEEGAIARALEHRMVGRAIALDGTCLCSTFFQKSGSVIEITMTGTGEHGVGVGKKEHLNEELGEGTVRLMKAIKKTIDPLMIFNPGK